MDLIEERYERLRNYTPITDVNERLKICVSCDQNDRCGQPETAAKYGRCKACGCRVLKRVNRSGTSCPILKW